MTATRAKLFCLGGDSFVEYANGDKFQEFWNNVDDCKVLDPFCSGNCKSEKLMDELRNFNKDAKSSSCKILVVGISSHGIEQKKDGQVSFDMKWEHRNSWEKLSVDEVLKIFDGNGKTNIILLQMCRGRSEKNTPAGDGKQFGVGYIPGEDPHSTTNQNIPSESQSADNSAQGDNTVPWPKTWKLAQPCIKNSIVVFSAPSGYLSHTNLYTKDDISGGWLFVAMKDVLEDIRGESISILQLFILVNKKMSVIKTVNEEQTGMSSFNHMLTENVVLKFKTGDKK